MNNFMMRRIQRIHMKVLRGVIEAITGAICRSGAAAIEANGFIILKSAPDETMIKCLFNHFDLLVNKT